MDIVWSSFTRVGNMIIDMEIHQAAILRKTAEALVVATNAFDVEQTLKLFTSNALIDDPSTGHRFKGHDGIRTYIEQYFIGYHTQTRIISMDILGDKRIRVRVDFSGDFGKEIGILEISVNTDQLIVRIDANLE
jgi:hypothetical protein